MWFANLPPASQPEEESQIVRVGRPPPPVDPKLGPVTKYPRLEIKEEESSIQTPSNCPVIDSRVRLVSQIEDEFLTTGCVRLDHFLEGGIPCRGLTEIYGQSAMAKTQFCLQLALSAHLTKTLGGFESDAVYITTEGRFPTKRLAELSGHLVSKHGLQGRENPMDSIIVEVVPNRDSLFRCLKVRLPHLLKTPRRRNIRLIIVDSLAAIFRSEYAENETSSRTKDLRAIANLLHKLGRELHAAVVVVNQATTDIALDKIIPALGLAWTNMVTTRLQLNRVTTTYMTDTGPVEMSKRSLEVVFASHLPPASIGVELSSKGIFANTEITYAAV